MFYDHLDKLCSERGVSVSGLLEEIGVSKSSASRWKNKGFLPSKPVQKKIADYFGISVSELMSGEPSKKEKPPSKEDDITFDDFTYAMHSETKELTEADRDLLLSMARQLKKAREQRDGENK